MMERRWTSLAGLVVLATAAGFAGCSSAKDDPEGETGGSGGSSGTAAGATGGTAGTAAGGTAGTAAGGTAGTAAGGTAGTAAGGTAGTTGGTGGAAPTGGTGGKDPMCTGIKSNMACAVEGHACPNLPCGLADSGVRECNCATNWTCTSCNYDNSQFKDCPAPTRAEIQQCPADAADEAPCVQEGSVCGPVGTEYCACYMDATDGLIWDCDSAPTSWTCQ